MPSAKLRRRKLRKLAIKLLGLLPYVLLAVLFCFAVAVLVAGVLTNEPAVLFLVGIIIIGMICLAAIAAIGGIS